MFRFIKYFSLLSIVLLLVTGYWQYKLFESRPLPKKSEVVFVIQPGESVKSVANRLKSRGIISSVLRYRLLARLTGHGKRIKTGEYLIKPGGTLRDLFVVIESGKSIGYKLTIPEGYNLYEVAKEVEAKGLASARDILKYANDQQFVNSLIGRGKKTLEGYLFPNTYFFSKKDGARKILAKMVKAFKQAFTQVGNTESLSDEQIVILASIIEKETGAAFERRKISSVFHNRLKKGMRLQTDPTVLYAKIMATGRFSNNITRKDLKRKHPYNTYQVKGLPPGPIANPGLASLKAAVSPEATKHLYFVSKNDGTHVFTDSYKDHKKEVEKYQLNPRARQGKSWRDLKNK